jgi:hypothetical protein
MLLLKQRKLDIAHMHTAGSSLSCNGLVCCTRNHGVCERALKSAHELKYVTIFCHPRHFCHRKFLTKLCTTSETLKAWLLKLFTCNSIKARAWVHQGKTTRWLDNRYWACWTECSLTFFWVVYLFGVEAYIQAQWEHSKVNCVRLTARGWGGVVERKGEGEYIYLVPKLRYRHSEKISRSMLGFPFHSDHCFNHCFGPLFYSCLTKRFTAKHCFLYLIFQESFCRSIAVFFSSVFKCF